MTSSAITLITTGGTIGSSIESDSVSVSKGQQQLQQHIQTLCERNQVSIKVRAAFNKNSEDLTPMDWLTLLATIAAEISQGSDKIIITHGTDTMAYSAAAIAVCLGHQPVKIILTGSCFTLDHPQSDVSANLLGALASASEDQISDGVYVSFLNADKRIQLIEALEVKPMAFDELSFRASFDQHLAGFNETLTHFTANTHKQPSTSLGITVSLADIQADQLQMASTSVIQIHCYPGINVIQLCAGLPAGSCVIVNLYHSGTGPSIAGENSLLDAVLHRSDLTFLLATLPSRYIDKPYQASVTLMKAGARLYEDLQPHVLYTLITLGLASGLTLNQLLDGLSKHQQPLPK